MNIDKEYEELKKILNVNKNKDETPEKRLYPNKLPSQKSKGKSNSQRDSIESLNERSRNRSYESPIFKTKIQPLKNHKLAKNPNENNHVGDGILYSIRGKHRYNNSIISKPQRDDSQNNRNILELGIVGEPIISSNSRIKALRKGNIKKDVKVTSLNTRLPQISDGNNQSVGEISNSYTSKNVKLPTLAKSNKRLIGIYGDNTKNKYKGNINSKYKSGGKYRYYSKERTGNNKSYLSKIEHSKSVNMLKLYKNKS